MIFGSFSCFLGESFLLPETENKKYKEIENVPTNQPYLEGLSALKKGFLFFMTFNSFYFSFLKKIKLLKPMFTHVYTNIVEYPPQYFTLQIGNILSTTLFLLMKSRTNFSRLKLLDVCVLLPLTLISKLGIIMSSYSSV